MRSRATQRRVSRHTGEGARAGLVLTPAHLEHREHHVRRLPPPSHAPLAPRPSLPACQLADAKRELRFDRSGGDIIYLLPLQVQLIVATGALPVCFSLSLLCARCACLWIELIWTADPEHMHSMCRLESDVPLTSHN